MMQSLLRQFLDLVGRWSGRSGGTGATAPDRPDGSKAPPWSGTTRGKRYKYEAVVKLLPRRAGDPEAALPGPVCHAVVRADHLETHAGKLFSALVTTTGEGSGPPGSAPIAVTMVVVGDDAGDYLTPGEHFALLRGGDVARGTVTRRIFV